MEVEDTNMTIQINPKDDHSRANDDTTFITQFKLLGKRTVRTNSSEENEQLETFYDYLRVRLTAADSDPVPRILAHWDEDEQAAQLPQNKQKLQHYGYMKNGSNYLRCYETLFLLEMGQLDLEYHGMRVSMEQAYLLLFHNQNSKNASEFRTYSTLQRCGYLLTPPMKPKIVQRQATETDCTWALLSRELEGVDLPQDIAKLECVPRITASMEEIKQIIVNQKNSSNNFEQSSSAPALQFNVKMTSATEPKPQKTRNAFDMVRRKSCMGPFTYMDCFVTHPKAKVQSNKRIVSLSGNPRIARKSKFRTHFEAFKRREHIKMHIPIFGVTVIDQEDLPTDDEFEAFLCQPQYARPIFVSISESLRPRVLTYLKW